MPSGGAPFLPRSMRRRRHDRVLRGSSTSRVSSIDRRRFGPQTAHREAGAKPCGRRFQLRAEPLNIFLKRFALGNQGAGAAQTYVAVADDRVVGYYSLTTAHVDYAESPERLRKG